MRHDETSTAAEAHRERDLRSSARAFLRAERVDDVATSDRALRSLFRALPSPLPHADFAASVLASVPLGMVRPAARRIRDLAPRHRWLVAAAALCAALGSVYLVPLLVLVVGQVEWGALVASVGATFGHLVSGLYGLAPFGNAAWSLLQAFWLFLSSPQVLFSLVIAASVVGLCVRLLTELIHSPQDPAHAPL